MEPRIRHSNSSLDHLDAIQWREQLRQGVELVTHKGIRLIIRLMTPDDVDDIYELEKRCFNDPWPHTAFQNEVDDPRYRLSMVGHIGHELVSYALCIHIAGEIHINNFAVATKHRRKGIAAAILQLIFRIAELTNVHISHLEVRKSNKAAISLYKKSGYHLVGIRKNYYETNNEDALLMSRTHP